MHGVHDVRARTLYEPGEHSEQDVEPVVDAYVPATQGWQLWLVVFKNVPAVHST